MSVSAGVCSRDGGGRVGWRGRDRATGMRSHPLFRRPPMQLHVRVGAGRGRVGRLYMKSPLVHVLIFIPSPLSLFLSLLVSLLVSLSRTHKNFQSFRLEIVWSLFVLLYSHLNPSGFSYVSFLLLFQNKHEGLRVSFAATVVYKRKQVVT